MNIDETLDILSKQWCDFEDFKKLSGLGHNTSWYLKKKIKKELENLGYVLPKGLLPMSIVVEKLHIDTKYLEKMIELQNKRKGD